MTSKWRAFPLPFLECQAPPPDGAPSRRTLGDAFRGGSQSDEEISPCPSVACIRLHYVTPAFVYVCCASMCFAVLFCCWRVAQPTRLEETILLVLGFWLVVAECDVISSVIIIILCCCSPLFTNTYTDQIGK